MSDFRTLATSELIAACLEGRQEAWSVLVNRYQDYVYTIIGRYLRSEDEQKDAFQNVYLILHANLRRLKNRGKLASYLFQITKRECLRIIRETGKEKLRETEILESFGYSRSSETPEDFFLRVEEQLLIREAIRSMPKRCRTILEKLFLNPERNSYEEVARELDIPTSSIGPYRQRCLRKLGEILDKMGVV